MAAGRPSSGCASFTRFACGHLPTCVTTVTARPRRGRKAPRVTVRLGTERGFESKGVPHLAGQAGSRGAAEPWTPHPRLCSVRHAAVWGRGGRGEENLGPRASMFVCL